MGGHVEGKRFAFGGIAVGQDGHIGRPIGGSAPGSDVFKGEVVAGAAGVGNAEDHGLVRVGSTLRSIGELSDDRVGAVVLEQDESFVQRRLVPESPSKPAVRSDGHGTGDP